MRWYYKHVSSRLALDRAFAFSSLASKRRGMIQWKLDTEHKRLVRKALHRLSVHIQKSTKATLVLSVYRWRRMTWWRRCVYGALRRALSINRRILLRSWWDCLKNTVKYKAMVETHFKYVVYTVFLSWRNAHRVKQLSIMHLKGVIMASELRM